MRENREEQQSKSDLTNEIGNMRRVKFGRGEGSKHRRREQAKTTAKLIEKVMRSHTINDLPKTKIRVSLYMT